MSRCAAHSHLAAQMARAARRSRERRLFLLQRGFLDARARMVVSGATSGLRGVFVSLTLTKTPLAPARLVDRARSRANHAAGCAFLRGRVWSGAAKKRPPAPVGLDRPSPDRVAG